jgi:hypothetical protein
VVRWYRQQALLFFQQRADAAEHYRLRNLSRIVPSVELNHSPAFWQIVGSCARTTLLYERH